MSATAPASERWARRSSDGVKSVEDQIRAGQLARVGRLVAPLHHPIGADDDQGALRETALVIDAEGAAGRALRLPVGQLLDGDAEPLLERRLRPRGVARDAIEPGAASLELAQHLLVDVELVGADRAE